MRLADSRWRQTLKSLCRPYVVDSSLLMTWRKIFIYPPLGIIHCWSRFQKVDLVLMWTVSVLIWPMMPPIGIESFDCVSRHVFYFMERKRKLTWLSGIFQGTAIVFSVILFIFSFACNRQTKSDVFQYVFPTGAFLLLMLNVILVIIIKRRIKIHNDKTQCFVQWATNPAMYSNDVTRNPENNITHNIRLTPSAPSDALTPSAPDFTSTPSAPDFALTPSSPHFALTPSAPDFALTPSAPYFVLTPSAPDFALTPSAPMFPQDWEYPIFPQGGSSLGHVNRSSVGCSATRVEYDSPPSYESAVEDPPSYSEAIKYWKNFFGI